MITPEKKDLVLNYLIEYGSFELLTTIDVHNLSVKLNISEGEIEAILTQFQNHQLITDLSNNGGISLAMITAELHDLYMRGGYVTKERLLEENIKKLHYEIEKLKSDLEPQYLDKLEKLSNIGNIILTAVGMFKG